jgi:hypothetical protein
LVNLLHGIRRDQSHALLPPLRQLRLNEEEGKKERKGKKGGKKGKEIGMRARVYVRDMKSLDKDSLFSPIYMKAPIIIHLISSSFPSGKSQSPA